MAEFDADHRLVLAAYRELSEEGLVEVRERGGVYVAGANAINGGVPDLPVKWFVDTLTDAFAHEIPAPELHEWLRRAIETLRLRAVVVSSTRDQVLGLARELREDFGLLAEGIVGNTIGDASTYPASLKRTDLIVANRGQQELAERLGSELDKPVILLDVRPDMTTGEWAMLLRQPVWAVVGTPEFGAMLREFFANVRGIENLHILVFGRDDLSAIPENAPTYVTHAVREQIGNTPLRGRILPPARTIAPESARDLFNFIVRANLGASRAVSPAVRDLSVRGS
jgi:hypothetical protein